MLIPLYTHAEKTSFLSFLSSCMPCASKRCSLCGGSHNIRTCKLPGAAKFRELVVQQHKPRKPLKGRKLRGHKPAVLSRKPARQVKRNTDKKTRKDFRTKQRLLYSGDKIQHGNRADRRSQKDNVADLLDPDRTTEKLLHLGYIQRPERCGKCGLRSVQGPFQDTMSVNTLGIGAVTSMIANIG